PHPVTGTGPPARVEGRGDDVRQRVLREMAYTAAAALLLGWMWLVPAVGVWATLAAELRQEPEPTILVVSAPQIVTAQVAAAEVQVATTSWYGPGFYGRPTASGAIYTGDEFTAA